MAETWWKRIVSGDIESGWSLFLEEYQGLLFGVIRTFARDEDERGDLFAAVCEKLRADDARRLREFGWDGTARFSTWLVTVVRNTAIDWYRRHSGRSNLARRLSALEEPQRQMFVLIAIEGLSYVETFEVMKSRGDYDGNFGEFLKEVRDLHESIRRTSPGLVRDLVGLNPFEGISQDSVDPTSDVMADCSLVRSLLSTMPLDVQTATLLFVVDGVGAGEVARIVGWPNAKAVYNRVYRTLATIREQLGESEKDKR